MGRALVVTAALGLAVAAAERLSLAADVARGVEVHTSCPFTKAEDNLLAKAKPSDIPHCCDNGAAFISCYSIELQEGDKVQWDAHDEQIPQGSFGVVKEVDVPLVEAKFVSGDHWLYIKNVNVLAATRPKSGRYSCECDTCAEAEGAFDIVGYFLYEMHKLLGQPDYIISRADLNPKGVAPGPGGMFPADKKYVLFLYPDDDDKGAFGFHPRLCERLACWKSRGYSVVMRNIGTKAEASAVLKQFPDRSIYHVVLGGHGSPTTLKWGRGEDGVLAVRGRRTKDLLKRLRAKTRLDATVILDSCFSAGAAGSNMIDLFGAGENLFSFVARKLHGRKVVGSTVRLTDEMWTKLDEGVCLAGDNVVFQEDGMSATSTAEAGTPKCRELGLADIVEEAKSGTICLSRCRSYCSTVLREWQNQHKSALPREVKLISLNKKADDRSSCWAGSRTVCRLSWEGS